MRTSLFLIVLCLAGTLGYAQQTSTIDFENLPEGQTVGSQISGLNFTNATVLQSGVSLNEIEYPPRSGTRVVCDVGGRMTIAFSTPVARFTGYFTHAGAITVQAVGKDNAQGQQVVSTADTRAGTGTPNEMLQVADANGITRVVIDGGAGGSSFTLDDVTKVAFVPPAPTFFIDITRMTFDAVVGRQAPPAQTVTVTADPNTSFTAVSNVGWLKATAAQFTTPANVAISANPANLDAGTSNGAITFTSGKGVGLVLSVVLRIAGKPSLFSTPTSFRFQYRKGDATPPAGQQLYVGANNANVDCFLLTKDSWVKASPDFATSGNLGFRHTVTVDVTKLDVGHYESAVYVYANEATNSPLTIPVVVDVTAATASAGGN